MEYAVVWFEKRERYGASGVAANLIRTGEALIVQVKPETLRQNTHNRFARVHAASAKMVELLGRVGDQNDETTALLYAYGIKPCRYPRDIEWTRPDLETRLDGREWPTASFDQAGTEDIDDAFSLLDGDIFPSEGVQRWLVIHISDVAARLSDAGIAWAETRASSAYYATVASRETVPMLPPTLAHDALSLRAGEERVAVSLFLGLDASSRVVASWQERTRIRNDFAVSYEEGADHAIAQVLCAAAGCAELDEAVAWAMVEFNTAFGARLRQKNIGVLRVQEHVEAPARYERPSTAVEAVHASLARTDYAHASSPIRRFADLWNHLALLRGTDDFDLDALNEHATRMAHFHSRIELSALAHSCRGVARHAMGTIALDESGRCLRVVVGGRRHRIVLSNQFYAEPLSAYFAVERQDAPIEMFGVLHRGFVMLRLRPGSLQDVQRMVDMAVEVEQPAPHPSPPSPPRLDDSKRVDVEALERVLGHPLDDFQTRCHAAIASRHDVIAMAPTGSGKTAVALTAVLCAFSRGQDAIYTSPIKALSNQKFAEFSQWFQRNGVRAEVGLLTGDIRVRPLDPSRRKLLICTSEILRNKLTIDDDDDLCNVGMLIADEVHYINDVDRGGVWEETMIHLPHRVSIVALSATLRHPEELVAWLRTVRSGGVELVTRRDRHVPLHFGVVDARNAVVELYCTHSTAPFDQTAYCRALSATPKTGGLTDARLSRDAELRAQSRSAPVRSAPARSAPARDHRLTPTTIARLLHRQNLCPAIVFVMARKGCVEAARSTLHLDLLGEDAPAVRTGLRALHRRHLLKHEEELRPLSVFGELMDMLDKGIAYHHSGMLPVLREFVEICFAAKYVRIVYATETLAIGINMPARSVVFTALEKPSDRGRRNLRPDEFWQMAGRAGRRGMDERGHVIYAPMREPMDAGELAGIVQGQMPRIESRLHIDAVFVLRNIERGPDILQSTLLHAQSANRVGDAPAFEPTALTEAARAYAKAQSTLQGQGPNGLRLVPTPKQRKAATLEVKRLEGLHGAEALRNEASREAHASAARAELDAPLAEWGERARWLACEGMLKDGALTTMGRVSAAFGDGQPLVMGRMICDGNLASLDAHHIYGWLACFIDDVREIDCSELVADPPLKAALDIAAAHADRYDADINRPLALLVSTWCQTHDFAALAARIEAHALGHFVKAIMRVATHVEMLREMLQRLMRFEEHARLDNATDALYGGIVSNLSLYVDSFAARTQDAA